MRSTRDARNWSKGYQEALCDIIDAIYRGSEAEAMEWIKNNGDEATRQHLKMLEH